jgi:hypothetical protein
MTTLAPHSRAERTLLKAAKDFVSADMQVQLARKQWRELHYLHPARDRVCCLRYPNTRRKWCEVCKRIVAEAVNYPDALWDRRAAKVRMKRAYRKLEENEGQSEHSEGR